MEDLSQPYDHHVARRPLARRVLELRDLGSAPRRRPRGDPHVAAGARRLVRGVGPELFSRRPPFRQAGTRNAPDVPLRVSRLDLLSYSFDRVRLALHRAYRAWNRGHSESLVACRRPCRGRAPSALAPRALGCRGPRTVRSGADLRSGGDPRGRSAWASPRGGGEG